MPFGFIPDLAFGFAGIATVVGSEKRTLNTGELNALAVQAAAA